MLKEVNIETVQSQTPFTTGVSLFIFHKGRQIKKLSQLFSTTMEKKLQTILSGYVGRPGPEMKQPPKNQ